MPDNTLVNDKMPQFGMALICIAIVGFIVSLFVNNNISYNFWGGTIPAISFLILMMGLVFKFPTMLEESPGQVSTMRIIVFAISMVFCVMYIRLAWNTSSLEGMKIDDKWVYILGLAWGSKVIQKFGEDNTPEDKTAAHVGEGK